MIKKHIAAQKMLKYYPVKIPYVNEIEFPSHRTRTRRDFARFLSLIEIIAILYQRQRETRTIQGSEFIIADLKDYEIAYKIVRDVLTNTLSEMPPKSRELRDACHALPSEFTRHDIQAATNWSLDEIRKYIRPLVEASIVEELQGNKGKAYKYKLLVSDTYAERPIKALVSQRFNINISNRLILLW